MHRIAQFRSQQFRRLGRESFQVPNLGVLEHAVLTAACKLDTLEALGRTTHVFGAIDRHCLRVMEREDNSAKAKEGAAEVLAEMRKRRDGQELLRVHLKRASGKAAR